MERRQRLRRSSDLAQLFERGRRYHHPLATVIIRPNGLDFTRFGFSASKRAGNAVARNRAKRLMREAVRRRAGTIQVGVDLLFLARRSLVETPYRDVERAVSQLLQMSGVVVHDKDG